MRPLALSRASRAFADYLSTDYTVAVRGLVRLPAGPLPAGRSFRELYSSALAPPNRPGLPQSFVILLLRAFITR